MKILVTGASGLIGSALLPFLATRGHEPEALRRETSGAPRHRSAGARTWNPENGKLDPADLAGFDAVVHLAGENLSGGRWTRSRRARILSSRREGTHVLSTALSRTSPPVPLLICASAFGYYGDRGEEEMTEKNSAGNGFLPQVVREWERAADPARRAGMRVVHLRFGIILTPRGGMLGKLLLPFRLGLGAKLGGGNQYMSWITLEEVLQVIAFTLDHREVTGAVNATSPHPVTNAEFTRTLGHVLHRPALFRIPTFALRWVLGQMAEETLLSGARALPGVLTACGYQFLHPELEGALRHLLGPRR